jgi:hypothetical protein
MKHRIIPIVCVLFALPGISSSFAQEMTEKERNITFSYALPQASFVDLRLCDISGKLVAHLANSKQSEGQHTMHFGTEKVPKGVYIFSLRSGAYTANRQVRIYR